jgi:hypothetical protein
MFVTGERFVKHKYAPPTCLDSVIGKLPIQFNFIATGKSNFFYTGSIG